MGREVKAVVAQVLCAARATAAQPGDISHWHSPSAASRRWLWWISGTQTLGSDSFSFALSWLLFNPKWLHFFSLKWLLFSSHWASAKRLQFFCSLKCWYSFVAVFWVKSSTRILRSFTSEENVFRAVLGAPVHPQLGDTRGCASRTTKVNGFQLVHSSLFVLI